MHSSNTVWNSSVKCVLSNKPVHNGMRESDRERQRDGERGKKENPRSELSCFFGSVFQKELRRSWAQVLRESDKIYSEKSFQSVGKLKRSAAAGRRTWVGGLVLSEGGGRAVLKMTAICLCDSRAEMSSAASDLPCICDIISARLLICR